MLENKIQALRCAGGMFSIAMYLTLISASFNLIYVITDQVIGFIGGQIDSRLGRDTEEKVNNMFLMAARVGPIAIGQAGQPRGLPRLTLPGSWRVLRAVELDGMTVADEPPSPAKKGALAPFLLAGLEGLDVESPAGFSGCIPVVCHSVGALSCCLDSLLKICVHKKWMFGVEFAQCFA